jgi:O-succinylhomoserine sulfhydrylase
MSGADPGGDACDAGRGPVDPRAERAARAEDWGMDTRAVRAGTQRSGFGEHSEALFLTSSFVFDSAAQAAARFSGSEDGNVYSRFSNPTVAMFEERLAAMEGGQACIATGSGMAAITTCAMTLLSAGEHAVVSRSVFGATTNLFENILSRFGVSATYVSPTDADEWAAAIRPETRMLYLETPSNPLAEIADVEAIAAIARRAGAALVVDNCFCTPALQRPLAQGADIVIHSATKYIDGQGRVLGGAIVGSREYIDKKVLPFLRTAGPSLSPFNAWVLLKGLETLPLRMRQQSANALEVARWLEAHPMIERVLFPGLESHPQFALAARQQDAPGAILSFVVRGDAARPDEARAIARADEPIESARSRAAAWRVIDGCRLLSITGNLGDTRTTITHPASTTHGRLTVAARTAAGIGEGLVRLSVGLESPADVCADLARGLDAAAAA